MFKKALPFFLIIVILFGIVFYSKNSNKAVKKIVYTNNPTIVERLTNSVEPTINKSEKIFLDMIEPKNNITVEKQAITVSGKTVDNGYVFVNEQEFKADPSGNFSTTVILEEGENYILIVVSDEYGNSSEKDILVTLESIN